MVSRITIRSSIPAQLPEPTMVGQDKLQVPTLSVNNFVNQELKDLKIHEFFLGITNILEENVMDSRYELVENDSDFEMTAELYMLEDQESLQQYLDCLEEKHQQQKFVW